MIQRRTVAEYDEAAWQKIAAAFKRRDQPLERVRLDDDDDLPPVKGGSYR